MVAAAFRTVFAQLTPAEVDHRYDEVADQLEDRFPKAAASMRSAKQDVLAFTPFPFDHWRKVWSNNPIEPLNKEIKRRTHVVGMFPSDQEIVEPIGGVSEVALPRLEVVPDGPGPLAVHRVSGPDTPAVCPPCHPRRRPPLLHRRATWQARREGALRRRRQLFSQAASALPPEIHDLGSATFRDHSVPVALRSGPGWGAATP